MSLCVHHEKRGHNLKVHLAPPSSRSILVVVGPRTKHSDSRDKGSMVDRLSLSLSLRPVREVGFDGKRWDVGFTSCRAHTRVKGEEAKEGKEEGLKNIN